MFERLDEVRSVARARAQEDFGFFCSRVLGYVFNDELALRAQRSVEDGSQTLIVVELEGVQRKRFMTALGLWVALLHGEQVDSAPSETFEWLFPEAIRVAA